METSNVFNLNLSEKNNRCNGARTRACSLVVWQKGPTDVKYLILVVIRGDIRSI